MNDNADPSPLRTATIAADRMVKAPLGLLVTFIGTVIGGSFWATCTWRDIQDLKRDMNEVKSILRADHGSQPIISKAGSP